MVQVNETNIMDLFKIIDDIRSGQHEICNGQAAILRRLDIIEAEQKTFRNAFPGGDLGGHCRFHQEEIDKKSENKKLRRAIIEKTLAGLVWVTIVYVAMVAWKEFAALVNHVVGASNVSR